MKMVRVLLFGVLALSVFAPSYAGKMAKAKGPLVVSPDKATIVFMRPGKFVGAAIAVPVFEVTGEDTRFVGIVDAGGKLAYSVPAGEHVFMTTVFGGDSGVRFQKADVEAGKAYYFRAHIINGLWGLEPVRASELSGSEFKSWDKKTRLIENSPKSLAWGGRTTLPTPSARRASSPRRFPTSSPSTSRMVAEARARRKADPGRSLPAHAGFLSP